MNSKIIAIILLSIALSAFSASAQSDAQFGQHYEIPTLYNPAAVGQTDFLKIRGAGRMQWVGVDGAPKTFLLTGDMPFKFLGKRFGVGLIMQQEGIGLYNSLNLGAQLAYKLKKWGGEFSGAIQFGMFDQKFKGSEVYIPDADDYHQSSDEGIPTTDLHGTALDLGIGLWYSRPQWQVGISVTHITSPTITMGGEGSAGGGTTAEEKIYEFNVPRTLYFMSSCNIPIKNTLFEVLPSMLIKSDFTFTTGELMVRGRYNKFLSAGLGYRWNDAVIIALAADIKNFYVGYSYEYATSAIHSASSGSHEFVVGYKMKLNLGEKNRNRHKNIRIM